MSVKRTPVSDPLVVELLAEARARKISAHRLSERCGYDRKTVSRMKHGLSTTRVSTLRDFGEALGLELVWRPLSAMTNDTDGRATDNQAQ